MIPYETGRLSGHAPATHPIGVLPPVPRGPAGLIQGTTLWTADGEIPVEFLSAGDRVITRRAGIQRLSAVETISAVLSQVRIAARALGDNVPEAPVLLPAEQTIFLGGPRGSKGAMIRAGDLVERGLAEDTGTGPATVFLLQLDQPDTLYASGLEVVTLPA